MSRRARGFLVRLSAAVAVQSLLLCNWAAAADSITVGFDMSSGQPVADVLMSPESWNYLGVEYVKNKMQTMTWVKPVGMTPREINKTDPSIGFRAIGLIGKPRESFSGEYLESFEYQSFPRPHGSPQQYFDEFKQEQQKACPSSSLTLIRATGKELLFESRSGGCERFGDQHEIDRFLFGKRSAFHMVYMVKVREMSAEQHDAATKAVTTWQLR